MRLSVNARGLGAAARLGILTTVVLGLAACGDRQSTGNMTALLMGPAGGEEVEMEGRRPEPQGGPRCPEIAVRDGTESLREYEPGGEGDPTRLRYQGTVSEVARECTFTGDNHVRIKFGVAGRLVTGPAGSPGNYQLPLRVAFARRGGDAVWSQLYRIPVTVEPGTGSARYNHVAEDIEFTIPQGDSSGWYIVYAGFDEMS